MCDKASIPPDENPVYGFRAVRYKRYKPNSQQAKSGIVGRWQEWNGYGWNNCDDPEEWISEEDLPSNLK